MPIERMQFEAQQDTLSMKILDYLQKNKNYAFTAEEISKRLTEDRLDVEVALNRLFNSDELLERKRIDGEFYYAIKKAITRLIETIF